MTNRLELIENAIGVPSNELTPRRAIAALTVLIEGCFDGVRASIDLGEDPPPAAAGGEDGTDRALPRVAELTAPWGGARLGQLLLYGTDEALATVNDEELSAVCHITGSLIAHLADYRLVASQLDDARHDSLHDPMTGLANRTLLLDHVALAIQRNQRAKRLVAVLFIDLDRFKTVNDLHGHQVGDELLVEVASRLRRYVRSEDTVARLGGDEFVVVCEGLQDQAEGEQIAAQLSQVVGDPYALSCGQIRIAASIGIAFATSTTDGPEQLINKADVAMYQAKHSGGAAYQVLDLRERRRSRRRAQMEAELQGAVSNGELQTVYQPIVETATGKIVGAEALLRWRNPRLGSVPPGVFVPVAERTGTIAALGEWVLQRACTDAAQLHLAVSINVSGRQISEGAALVRAVESVVELVDSPELITLELTEQTLIQDSATAHSTLSDLKGLGVSLALDDFGVGYSSLNYLSRMPIDVVKVDQSFIARLGSDPSDHAIVLAVSTLAHVLGITVVAEGVETAAQHDLVTVLGCDYSQGYFHAAPLSPSDLQEWLGHQPGRG